MAFKCSSESPGFSRLRLHNRGYYMASDIEPSIDTFALNFFRKSQFTTHIERQNTSGLKRGYISYI